MMNDIRANKERTDDRGVFGEIGVFHPTNRARQKVGERGDEDGLDGDPEGGEQDFHGGGGGFGLPAWGGRCPVRISEPRSGRELISVMRRIVFVDACEEPIPLLRASLRAGFVERA